MGGSTRTHQEKFYLSTDVPLSSRATIRPSISGLLATLTEAAAAPLRRRWVYQTTLLHLQDYSERSLQDIGAEHGAEEFARRAAGL